MKNRIVVDPNIHFGKPCVAGTKITVQNVLELVKEDISFNDITQDYYPELKSDDIQACIQYAIDVVAAEDIHITAAVVGNSCSTKMFIASHYASLQS